MDIPLDQEKIIEYGLRMQNLSILKRMAYLFDMLSPGKYDDFEHIVFSRLNLKYTLLDPRGPDTGKFNAKWRIRDNMQINIQSLPGT